MLWRDRWREFDITKVLQWVVISSTYQVFELSRVNYISFLFARSLCIVLKHSLKLRWKERRGNGLWKFNNSQIADSHFVPKPQNHTADTLLNIDLVKVSNGQCRWAVLKHKIRKFSRVLAQISKHDDLGNR